MIRAVVWCALWVGSAMILDYGFHLDSNAVVLGMLAGSLVVTADDCIRIARGERV